MRYILIEIISINFVLFFKNNMIRHESGYCLELSAKNGKDIYMDICNPSNQYQKWSWKKRFNNTTVAH